MELFCLSIPLFGAGALVVFLLRRTSRFRLSREESMAADLLEDVRALASKGDLARLRAVLASQASSFADGLLAILDAEPGSSWASPGSVAIGWAAHEGKRSNTAHTILAALTAFLILAALLMSALWGRVLTHAGGDPVLFLLGVVGTVSPWLVVAFAVHSSRLLDRERVAYALRCEHWLLEAASLLARAPAPPPAPPAVVS